MLGQVHEDPELVWLWQELGVRRRDGNGPASMGVSSVVVVGGGVIARSQEA